MMFPTHCGGEQQEQRKTAVNQKNDRLTVKKLFTLSLPSLNLSLSHSHSHSFTLPHMSVPVFTDCRGVCTHTVSVSFRDSEWQGGVDLTHLTGRRTEVTRQFQSVTLFRLSGFRFSLSLYLFLRLSPHCSYIFR